MIAGYGIKVETDTGHFVWLTEDSTTTQRTKAMRFESEAGAEMTLNMLKRKNPHVNLKVEKLTKSKAR